MANPNYTATLFINDVSGSMDGEYKPMEKVLHNMLEKQARKLAGFITVDVAYFDDNAYWGEVDADPMLVNFGLWAGGGTQIYDTSAEILNTFERRLDALPENEKPGHVVVVWMTDGGSSPAYSRGGEQIATRVRNLKSQKGWDFAFLGSFQGAYDYVGVNLGLDRSASIDYSSSKSGMEKMADDLGKFISMSRSGEEGKF